MKNPRRVKVFVSLALASVLFAGGCKSNTQSATQPAQQPAPNPPSQNQASPAGQQPSAGGSAAGQADAPQQIQATQQPGQQPPPPGPTVIPAGTRIVVSLGQTISSKTAQPGDAFEATVVDPVRVNGAVLIRAGAPARGTVVDAKALGRFKGGARLAIRLDNVRADGRTYRVDSSTVDRVEKGKGKRTAILTGGGGGFGALIGGLAGGGRGALIGGLAGAGAGVTGSAFTGNKELVIPAETYLTFRLERSVRME
jgi:hypothetical protein